MSTSETDNPRTHELERRIEEIEAHDEADFGHFTTLDWALCVVFAVALPLVAVWWWAP